MLRDVSKKMYEKISRNVKEDFILIKRLRDGWIPGHGSTGDVLKHNDYERKIPNVSSRKHYSFSHVIEVVSRN